MLFLFYTVARQLQKQPHWKDSVYQILGATSGKQKWKLFCVFGLMGMNWSVEALKWKLALKSIQEIRFLRALKAILAGTCIASFTPNRVGEYLGRMLFVEQGNKIPSIAPTILCSMSQMLITGITGTIGLYVYSRHSFHFEAGWLSPLLIKSAMIATGLVTIGFGMVFFRFDPLVKWVNAWLKRNRKTFTIPEDFNLKTLSSIFLLSAFRYGVFIAQYFLLFSLFGIQMNVFEVFTGVSVMFVLMAFIPTLTFLTDLGFRWIAGIQVFQVYTSNTAGILGVSLGIWLINLIIPALIGSLLILRIKLFSSR